MKKILLILLAAMMSIASVACGGDSNSQDANLGGNNPLVGKWAFVFEEAEQAEMEELGLNYEGGIEFTADGQYRIFFSYDEAMPDELEDIEDMMQDEIDEIGDMVLTYKVNGNQLLIEAEYDGEKESSTASFKIDGDTLTIIHGDDQQVFKRVR